MRCESGFTLFEVLIAAVVLVVGLVSLLGLLDTSVKASASTRAREGATNLAREILEDTRTIPYSEVSPGTIVSDLQAMNGLHNEGSEATWKINRRGVTYTVTASECAIDDPKDGLGKHTVKENFCPDSSTEYAGAKGETEDPTPEDLKRITVDVKWTARGRSPDVHEVATLTLANGAVGLNASELKLISPLLSAPTAPVVETPLAELQFAVTAPESATAVIWSVEGVRQGAATLKTGSKTTWVFSWPISTLSDGTYSISAQAENASGIDGPPIAIPVTLIRNVPVAPKITYGGFNELYVSGTKKLVVELQWTANSERNIVGYRVTNAKKEVVCASAEEKASRLSCIDFNPPSPKASAAELTYSVAALYHKGESEKLSESVSPGAAANFIVLGGPPTGPNEPTGPLSATKNGDGSVTLKWAAPSGGAEVIFYRIYRGSTDYTSRYDVSSSGSSTEYTDTQASEEHSYWVTAVGPTLKESPPLGPVTR